MSGDITVVVLAAGASRRLGQPKQLLPWGEGGATLLGHAVRTATDAALGPVVVVLGCEAARCRAALQGCDVTIVEHADWAVGIGSSIAAGVRNAGARTECEAVILMTCDQPGVSPEDLRALDDARRRTDLPMVAARYSGTIGTPALFARRAFSRLLVLSGAAGAKPVLLAAGDSVATVPVPGAALDVDTDAQAGQLRETPDTL